MKTKHTPSPWAIRDDEILGPHKSNKSIAVITGDFCTETEKQHNLKLLRTAPDLLQTLNTIELMLDGKEAKNEKLTSLELEIRQTVLETIKKAKLCNY